MNKPMKCFQTNILPEVSARRVGAENDSVNSYEEICDNHGAEAFLRHDFLNLILPGEYKVIVLQRFKFNTER